ncbi:Rab-GTPase-TBC domain [Popillia japonica]|uniref:Rab-GTPase-TBC domain n=1 Tax=Popillia japonica TaxID=7064 RepID=A0AAW1KGH1_POPJA
MSPVERQFNLLENLELQFGAQTFFAKLHKTDTCGSNGLPLTPNSIIIYGKAQILKNIKHKHLCQYLDIIRGKHERLIVVSQFSGEPLTNYIRKDSLEVGDKICIAQQIILGLHELHKREIVHRYLCSENVLIQKDGSVKLFNYGLYHMTNYGKLISFPLIQLLYAPPEVYLENLDEPIHYNKIDIWSVGIILCELALEKRLWHNLKLGQRIRKILSLIQSNGSVFERIAREHNCFEQYLELAPNFRDLIEDCLKVYAKDRPTTEELLQRDIFTLENATEIGTPSRSSFQVFTLTEFYHWWQLAGGDVFLELKKQGLLRSSPPILSLPGLILNDGTTLGQERNPATLHDPRIVPMPLDALHQRFAHIPLSSYYPLVFSKSHIIKKFEAPTYDVTNLPLVIRERDPEYQFHRVILLRKLLYGYPYTRDMIVEEAEIDIPPLLRGDIWMALLDIKGDYEREYVQIDKETQTTTDRQIEVDIPRCHQYNELLSSAEGHKKLKRILKAWVYKNSNYVYWQGLDSLTAPFLYLNFNNEAKAFACLSTFVPKYLHKFFLKDNSSIIQEYLAKFSQLIAFHDPILANHLQDINFIPELFAIPWFLTMFSHVFPLHKIFHLWDKLLQGDSSFPLHVGLSVLTQLRSRLLESGFNECILLFSDLPDIDMETCVKDSIATYIITPKSITARQHQNEMYEILDADFVSNLVSRCPRISTNNLVDMVRTCPIEVLVIDIRSTKQFNICSVIGSINIPLESVKLEEPFVENLGIHSNLLTENTDKNIVIVSTEDAAMETFAEYLLKCGVSRVCSLSGGFNNLLPIFPTILIPQNQI